MNITWREKVVVRILLVIAEMFCKDAEQVKGIRSLNAHISCGPMASERAA